MLAYYTDPLSSAAVFAYACGHSSCWPTGQTLGDNCYATSQELTEHWKFEHAEDMKCSTPFRCGLADCGKAWKVKVFARSYPLASSHICRVSTVSSIICRCKSPCGAFGSDHSHVSSSSKAHFQRALSACRTQEAEDDGRKRQKVYKCSHANCSSQYRQLSGLRYHLSHVRPACLCRYDYLT